ncbi:MAG: uncharacterized protein KVP18_001172 [Porospora cf. gigantea A]|uniref:uncharacterized protein n=1 Tax=Porospora cf. gigantea A TaxID=2853593 RepID=UPI00355A9D34|nr:MAG: hypothetical protein KVP18_001172 [Porospora cf. gigantea A]
MGAEISSCCGKDSTTDGAEVTVSPKKVQTATLQNGEKSAFVTRLEEGLTVNLILQDRRSLESTVKMDSYTKALIINCEVNGHKKVRSILASDVKQILQTKQQLRRVESRANIDDIELCAALHLQKSGNCIPLFFHNAEDKQSFVAAVQESWEM